MDVSSWVWFTTVGLLVGLLAVDVFVIGRRPHEPSMRECAIAITFYIGLALLFGLGVLFTSGGRYAGEFFAGWLTEYSLSIDNLFVFVIIMARLAVPRPLQQTALLVGVILALVMRGIFIALGAAAIKEFSWVFYIFGAFLIVTAVRLAMHVRDDTPTPTTATSRRTRSCGSSSGGCRPRRTITASSCSSARTAAG